MHGIDADLGVFGEGRPVHSETKTMVLICTLKWLIRFLSYSVEPKCFAYRGWNELETLQNPSSKSFFVSGYIPVTDGVGSAIF